MLSRLVNRVPYYRLQRKAFSSRQTKVGSWGEGEAGKSLYILNHVEQGNVFLARPRFESLSE